MTKAVSDIGTISVRTTGEHGLLGIALDPGFKTNKRLYLFYGAGTGAYEFRLSRFTMAGSQLDMNSEKIMLRIPADNNQWHTGGALMFDEKGDLWVTVGDNKSDEGGAPNSNSFLGKILRIHPMDDGAYTAPDGNLFPAGTAKTKPEVYIMGNRNPYSIAIDPLTGWPAWGEVGPDGFGADGGIQHRSQARKLRLALFRRQQHGPHFGEGVFRARQQFQSQHRHQQSAARRPGLLCL